MQPVDLDDADAVALSPCQKTVYAKDQPEYIPLPVVRLTDPTVPVISRWRLSPEEKLAIENGADVYLTLYTFAHPLQPIKLRVGCPAREELV